MADLSVTFLGSGDALGSGGRFQTCILVTSTTARFLLDCGASSLIAMKRQGTSPATIETILVTHLHGDHFAGIPFFILDAQFSRREAPLLIAGPPGIQARVRDAMEILFPRSSETVQRPSQNNFNAVKLNNHSIQLRFWRSFCRFFRK